MCLVVEFVDSIRFDVFSVRTPQVIASLRDSGRCQYPKVLHVLHTSNATPNLADVDVAASLLGSLVGPPAATTTKANDDTNAKSGKEAALASLQSFVSSGNVASLTSFMSKTPDTPLLLHSTYRAYQNKLIDLLTALPKLTADGIMQSASSALSAAGFNTAWIEFCLQVADYVVEHGDLPDNFKSQTPSLQELENFCKLRARYVVASLVEVDRIFVEQNPFHGVSLYFTSCPGEAIVLDVAATTNRASGGTADWSAVWVHFLLQLAAAQGGGVQPEVVSGAAANTIREFNLIIAKKPASQPQQSPVPVPPPVVPTGPTTDHLVPLGDLYGFLRRGSHDLDLDALVEGCPALPSEIPTCTIDPESLTMHFIDRLCCFIQLELYNMEIKSELYKLIMLDISAKPRKLLIESSNFESFAAGCMHFAGSVSTRPDKGSHYLIAKLVMMGSRLEIPIYVNGGHLCDLGTSCPVPAWMVPTAGKNDEAKAVLKLTSIMHDLTLPDELHRSGGIASITVQVPVLQLVKDAPAVAAAVSAATLGGGHATIELIVEADPAAASKKRKRVSVSEAAPVFELLGADALCAKVAPPADGTGGGRKAKCKATKHDWSHLLR
jgi:hypothetical protein